MDKILYLSKNMDGYQSAMYQSDVMNELSKQADVRFYGEGFEHYNGNDSIHDVLDKLSFIPDYILAGHSWLIDQEDQNVDPQPSLNLSRINIPKFFILNKEYVNLESKIKYFIENKFLEGFSHHHNVDKLSSTNGLKIKFWPFAYDHNKFASINNKKEIDLAFSGILINYNKNANQSNTRARVMKKIFYTFADVPLFKKNNYKDLNIYWNSFTTKKLNRYLTNKLKKRVWHSNNDYVKLLKNVKVFINTPSPVGLISPRYFECMAARTVVLCEDEPNVRKIFPSNSIITFKSDLSDFDSKFNLIIHDKEQRRSVIENALKFVSNHHTWNIRIKELITHINTI